MSETRRRFIASAYLCHEGEVLLINHNKFGGWVPVGGGLEPGETPLEAALRETVEETGLTPTFLPRSGAGIPDGFLRYYEFERDGVYHLNFCFVATVPTRDVKSDGSYSDVRWVSPGVAAMDTQYQPTIRGCLFSIAHFFSFVEEARRAT